MSQETIRKLAERIFTGLWLPERYKKSSMETITAELAPFGALLEAAKPFAKCTMAGSLDPRECAELQKSERWQKDEYLKNYFCDGCKLRAALSDIQKG